MLVNEGATTLGVEEEFLLIDPIGGSPVGRNTEVAAAARTLGTDLQLELTSCQVETSTDVHTDARRLGLQLRSLRASVDKAARDCGARVLAVATPPTVPTDFPVTDTPRYRRIAERYGMLAHEQGICGAHVHVGVPDRETAVQVGNYLRPWLPALLALTANSAVHRGADTGFASWRSILWRRWPSAGPPPYFGSAGDYDAMVEMMLATGGIMDENMAYWDVRPSNRYPTVEIRVSDIPATADESVLLAILIRASVTTARMSLQKGNIAPNYGADTLRAAYWTAAHNGLAGAAIDVRNERIVPARTLIRMLVSHVRDALDETGDTESVRDGLSTVFREGNGATRQRESYRRRRNAADVVADVARATLSGCEPPH